MAIGTPVVGTTAYSASGGTSVAPSYPASVQATDELVMFVGMKPSTANRGTLTAPTGWTIQDSLTASGGYGTTLGADAGNTNLWVLTKDTVTAGLTGTVSVTLGANGVSWAFIARVPTSGGTISYGTAGGQRSTAPTAGTPFSVTLTDGASPTGFTTGDLAIWAMCIPTDVTTPSQFSAQDITATGATFGTPIELNEPDSQTGNDIGGYSAWDNVDSGSSTVAPTVTVTASGTATNVRGPIVLLRIRETLAERTGNGAATEAADDVAFGDGGTLVQGAGVAEEIFHDTASATGTVSDPAIVGSGVPAESGSDLADAVGFVLAQGAGSAGEAGPDLVSGQGAVLVQGSGAFSEDSLDAASAAGQLVPLSIGDGEVHESGEDLASGFGGVLVHGAGSANESGTDQAVGSGGSVFTAAGVGVAQESGADEVVGLGSVLLQGDATIAEASEDLAASDGTAGGSLGAVGAGAAVETGVDAISGYVLPGYVESGYVFGVSGTVSGDPEPVQPLAPGGVAPFRFVPFAPVRPRRPRKRRQADILFL